MHDTRCSYRQGHSTVSTRPTAVRNLRCPATRLWDPRCTDGSQNVVPVCARERATDQAHDALEAHLEAWSRDFADERIHGTTGEAPTARFVRDEAVTPRSVDGIPPFHAARELTRIVQGDCSAEVDANAYSVPWRLVGERVRVTRDQIRAGWPARPCSES